MRKIRATKPKIQGPFGLVVSHSVLMVLLLGVLASALASWLSHNIIRRDEAQRFEMARQEVEDLVRTRLDRILGALQHTRAFLTTKERVSRQDFRLFLQSVDLPRSYPDLVAIGFADRIAPAHRAAHERDVREDGYARYHVWPRVKGAASHLYPVKYIEPFDAFNQPVLGFDLHTEPRRALAMDRARDSGEPALTEALQLVQDSGESERPGYLLFLPVYRRGLRVATAQERRWALEGFVYAPFRAADFFRELYRSSAVFHKGVGLRARDPDGTELYNTGFDSRGPLHASSLLHLFGETWTVEVFDTPGFASPADRAAPLFVFLTGLLITALVAWVMYATGRHAESQREAIELRDEFLSICSHELRTPLTSMKLQNQLVQRTFQADIAAGNSARIEKMVMQSGRQIERLVRLVEEMLDISRIRSGKLSITPENLDLTQLVYDTVERFGPHLAAVGCAVDVHAPPSFPGRWDRLRLEQVLVNLLSNAMKYGAGKPIRVELFREGDRAVLSVRDEGMGIAPEHQTRIFERFERAVSKSEISGLGLGLYISKQIVELQSGLIRVESVVGHGSRFVVELPLAEASAQPSPPPHDLPPPSPEARAEIS